MRELQLPTDRLPADCHVVLPSLRLSLSICSRCADDAVWLQSSIPRAQVWAANYDPAQLSCALSSPRIDSDLTSTSDQAQLLNLSQGVPGDPPHADVLAALAQTSSDPANAGYGGIAGEDTLRAAVSDEYADVYRWPGWNGALAPQLDVKGRQSGAGLAVGEGQGKSDCALDAADGVGVGKDNVMITGGANASYREWDQYV